MSFSSDHGSEYPADAHEGDKGEEDSHALDESRVTGFADPKNLASFVGRKDRGQDSESGGENHRTSDSLENAKQDELESC